MPNQYNHTRNWDQELRGSAARLQLCVVLPDKVTANARIRSICLHGVKSETTVYRLCERKYCCKSQASKAHDSEMKSKAAKVAWDTKRDLMLQRQKERWNRSGEKEKHSQAMVSAIENLRETGWANPGWGYGPTEEERKLPGTLYFIRYLDSTGIHFKIGITKRSLQDRLGDKLVSILHLHQATLGECFDLEQSLLKWAKENNYRYSSPTTTELIRPEAYSEVLDRLRGKTK